MTDRNLDAEYLRALTVLYVEDDPGALEVGSVFLRRRVAKVVTARHGAEGLAVFHAEKPHLIVTDIQMPIMDGLAMVQEIRKTDPEALIIVTRAFEQTDYLLRAIELGIERYVLKPIRAEALEAALQVCAHRLRVEAQIQKQQELEAELVRTQHQAAISTLLGGVGHDYNNLLQVILACQELALAGAEPGSKVHRILQTSRTASSQAQILSRRLLSLVNVTEGQSQVGRIQALIQAAASSLVAGSPVSLEFDFQGGDPPVRHDAIALRQALSNLVVNALEAMPEGGTLKVSTWIGPESSLGKSGLPAEPCLHLSLRDTGKGILLEDLPKVFEPYFTTKERGSQRGTGLGLALCEAIVHTHGGSLRVESTPGQGATFYMQLPLSDQADRDHVSAPSLGSESRQRV